MLIEGSSGFGSSAQEAGSRSFSVWLKAMAEYAGVADASSLHAFLLAQGCLCTRESTADWLSGKDPSYEKSRDIIKAFHTAFPDLEVWQEYKRFVNGEPYLQSKGGSGAGETLEQILKQSGLPPGLQD